MRTAVELMREAFGADASVVSGVRERVRAHLDGRLPADRVDEAVLVVSELVTNAITHARTPFEVVLSLFDHRVRFAVTDDSTEPPVPVTRPGRGGGFGLALVEQLTDAWGYDVHPAGKTVWCELLR
jgi:anti-sigma regulatory factor (Ser/Thr protein kinase)